MKATLDAAVRAVVDAGNCTGCGACTLLDTGLGMQVEGGGWARPVRVEAGTASPGAVARFAQVCPGRTVRAAQPEGSARDPLLGPVLGCWEACARDPQIRRRGSSGGVLTALTTWLVEQGEAVRGVAAGAAPGAPRRTVPVTITTRADALASAGSRYAPVGVCAHPDAADAGSVTTGKPCEVAALRALTGPDDPAPLLLSFFCAGTPSAAATDDVLSGLGVGADEPLDALRYRGDGWPGEFAAVRPDGRRVATSYHDSWGEVLGKAVQWRCKTCPDGVGESADVVAGDLWRSDERGYPLFDESDGWSALVARTARGRDVVERAVAAGVLEIRPVDPGTVMAVQPLQRARRRTLAGRLLGARLAGARPPRYRGFGLLGLAARSLRENVRTARGTYGRVRAGAARRG